jgi:hypothetical protein
MDAIKKQFSELSPQVKRNLMDELKKTYRVLFSSITGKEALIKGYVFGVDVFNRVEGAIDQKAEEGGLSRLEAENSKKAINLMRAMTPEERRILLDDLEKE